MADELEAGRSPTGVVLPFSIRGIATSVIVFAASIAALQAAAPLLIPILISILLAYTLEPLVGLLIQLRVPRVVAAVLVFGFFLVALRAGGRVVLSQANAFVHDLPETAAAIRDELSTHRGSSPGVFEQTRRAAAELEKATTTVARPTGASGAAPVTMVHPPVEFTTLLVANGTVVAWSVGYTLGVGLLTFLLLATGDIYRRKILRLAPQLESRKITFEVMKSIDRQIERYLVIRVLISAIVGTLTAFALWPLGLHHWLIWGVTTGVLNVLPFIGPTVAVALVTLAAFLQFKGLALVATAGGLSGLVAMFEGNLLTPWLTSRAGELNTVAVFVGVLFWGWLWGIWGLLLAVPIMVAAKAAADHIEPLQPLAELLGR